MTIWSIEAEVSATLDACTWVFFTTFCTLTLISCIVLVTSSIAEAACTLTLADSSEALAICPGAAGHLRGAVAHLADQFAQALRHAREGFGHGVLLRARLDGHEQLPFGDCRGHGGHLLQVDDHLVEILGEHAHFVVAMNINGLVEIAGVADLVRHFDEVVQRVL